MLDIFKERLHQKYRTLDFPRKAPGLSPRYMGRPEITAGDCGSCGAPTCNALAEDIVRGEASEEDCIIEMRRQINEIYRTMGRMIHETYGPGSENPLSRKVVSEKQAGYTPDNDSDAGL